MSGCRACSLGVFGFDSLLWCMQALNNVIAWDFWISRCSHYLRRRLVSCDYSLRFSLLLANARRDNVVLVRKWKERPWLGLWKSFLSRILVGERPDAHPHNIFDSVWMHSDIVIANGCEDGFLGRESFMDSSARQTPTHALSQISIRSVEWNVW